MVKLPEVEMDLDARMREYKRLGEEVAKVTLKYFGTLSEEDEMAMHKAEEKQREYMFTHLMGIPYTEKDRKEFWEKLLMKKLRNFSLKEIKQ